MKVNYILCIEKIIFFFFVEKVYEVEVRKRNRKGCVKLFIVNKDFDFVYVSGDEVKMLEMVNILREYCRIFSM